MGVQRRHLPRPPAGHRHQRGGLRRGLCRERQGTVLPRCRHRPGDGRAWRRGDHQPGSWIVRLGHPAAPLYSSTKGAIETLTRAWAAEFGLAGVRVNAISPVVIRPPTPAETNSAVRSAAPMMRGTPAGDAWHPRRDRPRVGYLASDESAFVHGTIIDVDSGRADIAVIDANANDGRPTARDRDHRHEVAGGEAGQQLAGCVPSSGCAGSISSSRAWGSPATCDRACSIAPGRW